MEKSNPLKYCSILGTNINVTTMEQTVSYLNEHLDALRGNYICVSNVHTTVMAYRDTAYRTIQNCGAMAIPDGKPLAIVSRRRGYWDAERVPGPDLMARILKESKEKGYRHYFFGSTEETIQQLGRRLKEEYPWIKIAGMYSPPFRKATEEEDKKIIHQINAAAPDFVWVALGAPKQEQWMYEHQFKINALMIGVGAAFDFHAGTVKRAPKWMQECCLEWLYRITQDPVRLLPRYLCTNFAFLRRVFQEGFQSRRQRRKKSIVMIGHKRIPSREGGVEIVVDELATRLVQKGYWVDAYNRSGYHVSGKEFDEKRGKVYNGIRLFTIPTFKSSRLNAIVYSFLATIRALFGNYSVYHYHAEGPSAMLWMLKIFRKKIVVTIHGLDWQRAKWGNFASRVLKFGEKQAVKHADHIIVLSRNIQQYFLKEYGRETVFIPNGITRPQKCGAKIIKERWGLEQESYILFLARLVPEKGAHYLMDAYEELHTDKKLVIAGGSSHSTEYVSHIYEMAEKNKNIILTGFVQGRELEELFSNAYLFVLPSDVEGMAISLLEAMSYGNCCVVSNIPENMEVVGDHAVSFERGNYVDLKEKLQYLLERRQEVEKLGTESSSYICSRYNWDDVVDRTIEIYYGEKNESTLRETNK